MFTSRGLMLCIYGRGLVWRVDQQTGTDTLIPYGVTRPLVKVTATEGQPLPTVRGPCLVPFSSVGLRVRFLEQISDVWVLSGPVFPSVKWDDMGCLTGRAVRRLEGPSDRAWLTAPAQQSPISYPSLS